MGRRPLAPEVRVLSVRLPREVYDAWEKSAQKKGRTISEHIRLKLTESTKAP